MHYCCRQKADYNHLLMQFHTELTHLGREGIIDDRWESASKRKGYGFLERYG